MAKSAEYQLLWFDVEIGYYTTIYGKYYEAGELWFDVEIGYYTTGLIVEEGEV